MASVDTKKEEVDSEKGALHVVDSRTSKEKDIPIENGNAVYAMHFRDFKESPSDFGVLVYDPGIHEISFISLIIHCL